MRKGWGDLATAFREASDEAERGALDGAASRAARLEAGRIAREELLADLVEFGQAVGLDVSRDDEFAIIWTAGKRSVRFRAMGAGDRVGVEFRELTSREGRIYREQLLEDRWIMSVTHRGNEERVPLFDQGLRRLLVEGLRLPDPDKPGAAQPMSLGRVSMDTSDAPVGDTSDAPEGGTSDEAPAKDKPRRTL